MKRIATPEEVAHAITFLIHPATTFTTGGVGASGRGFGAGGTARVRRARARAPARLAAPAVAH
jgi:hypothetical protein